MALAVISTAFTGQAIAVAFDRRYGALKRLGRDRAAGVGHHRRASRWPWWPVVFLQSILLGAIGFALGWRPQHRRAGARAR